jgi:hypothetical protein
MKPFGNFENPDFKNQDVLEEPGKEGIAKSRDNYPDFDAFPEYPYYPDEGNEAYPKNDNTQEYFSSGETEAALECEPDFEATLIKKAEEASIKISQEHKRPLSMAELEHSDWMKAIEAHIFDLRNEPELAREFWEKFNEKMGIKDDATRENMESFKYEILSHIAAQNFIKDLEQRFRKEGNDIEINIISSTPEEDVEQKVDFWTNIKCTDPHGKIFTRNIPCRVVCIDISKRLSDRESNGKRGRFILDNFASFKCPDAEKMSKVHIDLRDQYKMKEFYKNNPEGLLFLMSRFENMTLLDDGQMNETLKKSLTKSILGNERFRKHFLPYDPKTQRT